MDFSSMNIHISLSNLVTESFNSLTFSMVGILIVFSGLIVISLYIKVLPSILNLIYGDLEKPKKVGPIKGSPEQETDRKNEILIAVATAIHLDQTRADDNLKITWERNKENQSPWATSGIFNQLTRKNVTTPRR